MKKKANKHITPSGGTTGLIQSGYTSGTGGIKEIQPLNSNSDYKIKLNHNTSKFVTNNEHKNIIGSEENDESDRFVNINFIKMSPIEEKYVKRDRLNKGKYICLFLSPNFS